MSDCIIIIFAAPNLVPNYTTGSSHPSGELCCLSSLHQTQARHFVWLMKNELKSHVPLQSRSSQTHHVARGSSLSLFPLPGDWPVLERACSFSFVSGYREELHLACKGCERQVRNKLLLLEAAEVWRPFVTIG